jgi:Putative DNA-binding domain
MTQDDFAAALLDPDSPVPASLVGPSGQPATRRFAVYRNNVAVGLTEALQTSFPVVRKLVGEAFFAAMAGVFLRRHPPQSRIMMLYGDAFADFLAAFPPVAHLGYLPDVARLEQGLRESYHAADASPIAADALAAIPEAALLASRLKFAPAMRLVRSPWPIHGIWRANAQGGPAPQPGAEDVLLLRPDFDPAPHLLPKGGGDFIASLQQGATLVEALSAAGPDLDLPAVLALLLDGRALIGVSA